MKCKFKLSTIVELGVGVAAIAALLLAGCGGGGSSAVSSSASTELSGIASKGPVANGTITAFSIANGQKDKSLASVTSDNSGSYTLKLGAYTGPVLIEVTGGSYRDEATGNTVPLASTLRSAVAHIAPNKSGSALIKSASVTPITEAAVQNAATGAGGLTPTNIQTANDDVKAQLGFDPVSTQPTDATNPAAATASIAAKTYAALLGTVSQYLKDNPSKSLANASSDFAIALKPGGSGLAGNALITASGNNFGVNANNKTGVSSMSALQTLNATLLAPIDDENPVSQRIVAAALFNEPSILACGSDSVAEYPNTCSTKYNYNLSGMPGCFSADYSNYIGHYQKNGSGIDWKTPGFLCTEPNIYESFVWSMNDGRVMDGTHNGIDFRHKDTTGTNIHPAFYAVTPGVVINAGTGSLNTIAIYLADPSDPTNTSKGITTLYLHASSVNTDKVKPGAIISFSSGDPLGYQGNSGLGLDAGVGEHVHVSVRSGWVPCASNSCSDGKSYKNGYLPPVATLLTYITNKLNDTGITASQCYQAGSDVLVACSSAGAIALNNAQDGMAGRDANAATNGNTDGKLGFSFSAVPGGCVQDNVTGLMWEVKTTDGGLRDRTRTYTNYSATYNPSNLYGTATDASGFVAAVNAANLCGYSDWRLPTVDELQSIVDYGVAHPGPTIDATWFPNTQGGVFWSSSPTVGFPSSAWLVFYNDGYIAGGYARSNASYVRLVRAGQSQTLPRYIVSADGQEVADKQTKLIWRRCAEGMVYSGGTCTGAESTFTHEAALQHAAAQASNTGIGWRLPNVKELSSIADKSLIIPAIDPTAFPNTYAYYFWSASPVIGIPLAWQVDFLSGQVGYAFSRSTPFRVRLVRDVP